MKDILNEIMSHKEKTLNEVAEMLEVSQWDVLEAIIERERAPVEYVPSAVEEPQQIEAALSEDERTDEQLAIYFLNRLQKESLSIAALNNKYKINDEERVERILENLAREGKLAKRESRNKRGRFVYEMPTEQ